MAGGLEAMTEDGSPRCQAMKKDESDELGWEGGVEEQRRVKGGAAAGVLPHPSWRCSASWLVLISQTLLLHHLGPARQCSRKVGRKVREGGRLRGGGWPSSARQSGACR